MASINHIISEIAHAMGDAYNHTLRNGIREAVIHERAEKIRHSYEKHGYIDDVLLQRFNVSIKEVSDGDINIPISIHTKLKVYRTNTKTPKALRLTNNLPFESISFLGANYGRTISKFDEKLVRFVSQSTVLRNNFIGYAYVNGYVYLFSSKPIDNGKITIKSAFELPIEIPTETSESTIDNDDYLIPEDIVPIIFDTVFKRYYLDVKREQHVNNQTP